MSCDRRADAETVAWQRQSARTFDQIAARFALCGFELIATPAIGARSAAIVDVYKVRLPDGTLMRVQPMDKRAAMISALGWAGVQIDGD